MSDAGWGTRSAGESGKVKGERGGGEISTICGAMVPKVGRAGEGPQRASRAAQAKCRRDASPFSRRQLRARG